MIRRNPANVLSREQREKLLSEGVDPERLLGIDDTLYVPGKLREPQRTITVGRGAQVDVSWVVTKGDLLGPNMVVDHVHLTLCAVAGRWQVVDHSSYGTYLRPMHKPDAGDSWQQLNPGQLYDLQPGTVLRLGLDRRFSPELIVGIVTRETRHSPYPSGWYLSRLR